MDSKEIIPIEQIKNCIRNKQSFVLQGGAGSGKTETLKQTLEFISENFPAKKIACITHTNLAVDEIKSRVIGDYTICTIHSFLNSLIKNFKKNIHQVIFEIFKINKIDRQDLLYYGNDVKLQNEEEHKNYKKIYGKYSSQLFKINKGKTPKVVGKKEYDINPLKYKNELNTNIDLLNIEIEKIIQSKNFNKIKYNETKFNSLENLTFGHDSLLTISHLLFKNYNLIGKIINDKYDFIFVDEFQDTDEKIIDIFLNLIPNNSKTVVGLFGDAMQGIYDSGIGNVDSYIASNKIIKIEKQDNFRCSEQVKDFINNFRNDGLVQKVALKKGETKEQREGFVKLYYSIYDKKKPSSNSKAEDKEEYLKVLNSLICEAENENSGFKKLMLTNKSISIEVGFENLYKIFSDRYTEVKDEIEKLLERLQMTDLAKLYTEYRNKNYNFVISKLKKTGFVLKTANDKNIIKDYFENILKPSCSVKEAMDNAFKNNVLKKSETYFDYELKIEKEFAELLSNTEYQEFKKLYDNGQNTHKKITSFKPDLYEEEFNELEYLYKRENFYRNIFSNKLIFSEVINYYEYISEIEENKISGKQPIKYITMHKTKGSGIENVCVILDEYFWNDYDFKAIFDKDTSNKKYEKSLKLFYVTCSRAKTNLIIVRLVSSEEESKIKTYFSDWKKIEISYLDTPSTSHNHRIS